MENEYDDRGNNKKNVLLLLLHAIDRRMDRWRCGWLQMTNIVHKVSGDDAL
jgi:hypothetical protein